MSIQILLRRNIDGLGNVGETVRVRNGYARNFLIPKGHAALVSADAMHRIGKDKKVEAVRQAEEDKARIELAEVLSGLTATIEARAGDEGHLYGSVGPKQVAESLAREGFHFDLRQLRFEPFRELGEYEVPVALTREHVVNVKVWVVQDAREAAAAAADAAERAAYEAEAPAVTSDEAPAETTEAAPETADETPNS